MKFKTRDKQIQEYNAKYPVRDDSDLLRSLRSYFKERRWNFEKASKKAAEKASKIIDEREYRHITITLYEYAMKTDRPRVFRGHAFSPNAAANHKYFEKNLKKIIKDLKLINTPAEISIEAYLEMPSTVPPDEVLLFEAKLLNPIDYPDYDNLGKCYTDMLKNTLIIDDDIFYKGTITKYYSVMPRVVMTITFLSKHESDFIYKKIKNRKSVKEMIQTGQCEIIKIGEGKN